MKSFMDVFNEAASVDEITTSPPLPGGTYELVITKVDPEAKLKRESQGYPEGTEFLAVYFRPVDIVDVDEEALAEVEDWKQKMVSLRCLTPEDVARFMDTKTKRGLVYDCGLEPKDYFEDGKMDWDRLAADMKDKVVEGILVQSPNKDDPDRPYVNLRSTAPVSD